MNHPVVLSLPTPDLFSFDECLWFLDRNFDDCMQQVGPGCIYKALDTGQDQVLFRLDCVDACLQVRLLVGAASAGNLQFIEAYITEWLHLDADLRPFYQKLEGVKPLAYMATAFRGLRLPAINSLFEALCWSIIGQQINLTFAYKLKRRLVEHYGTSLTADGITCFMFPAPAVLARATEEVLREMQFSRQKASYLIALAQAFDQGSISRELDPQATPVDGCDAVSRHPPAKGANALIEEKFLVPANAAPTLAAHLSFASSRPDAISFPLLLK